MCIYTKIQDPGSLNLHKGIRVLINLLLCLHSFFSGISPIQMRKCTLHGNKDNPLAYQMHKCCVAVGLRQTPRVIRSCDPVLSLKHMQLRFNHAFHFYANELSRANRLSLLAHLHILVRRPWSLSHSPLSFATADLMLVSLWSPMRVHHNVILKCFQWKWLEVVSFA